MNQNSLASTGRFRTRRCLILELLESRRLGISKTQSTSAEQITLTPAWTQAEYAHRFQQCHDYIFAGDVYQINLTFPLYGHYDGDALALYRGLRQRQPVAYGGVVALGDETVVSLSPEVFLSLKVRIFARGL